MSRLNRLIKRAVFRTPLRNVSFNLYPYMYSPGELRFIMNKLEEALAAEGSCVEIGCAAGATSLFLNLHLKALGQNRKYYSMDTFDGFVSDDIRHDESKRKKSATQLSQCFKTNHREFLEYQKTKYSLHYWRITKADINTCDLNSIGPICFGLLDVDLYQPMKAALEKSYQLLAPQGVLLVDDCTASNKFDGALQAYQEFCENNSLQAEIHGKIGVIQKCP